MATWKQIEASREIRLWVTQVIAPTLFSAGMLMTIPEVREKAKTTASKVKEKFEARFKK